jgi:hypothetical protein
VVVEGPTAASYSASSRAFSLLTFQFAASRCRLLAPFGHAGVVAPCPQLRDERTWLRRAARSESDPQQTLDIPSCLNQSKRKRPERTPVNVSGFRSWSARDEDGVDALQHHFAFLIVEVHLVADNAPIRIRLRLALL